MAKIKVNRCPRQFVEFGINNYSEEIEEKCTVYTNMLKFCRNSIFSLQEEVQQAVNEIGIIRLLNLCQPKRFWKKFIVSNEKKHLV